MKRDLKYWKFRQVELREAIRELQQAHSFACRKIRELEKQILSPKQ